MTWIPLLLSAVVALFGFTMLTQATNGVGAIALACWLAIVARIAQASDHRAADLKAKAAPPVPAADAADSAAG